MPKGNRTWNEILCTTWRSRVMPLLRSASLYYLAYAKRPIPGKRRSRFFSLGDFGESADRCYHPATGCLNLERVPIAQAARRQSPELQSNLYTPAGHRVRAHVVLEWKRPRLGPNEDEARWRASYATAGYQLARDLAAIASTY